MTSPLETLQDEESLLSEASAAATGVADVAASGLGEADASGAAEEAALASSIPRSSYIKLTPAPLAVTFSQNKVWFDEAAGVLHLMRRGEFRSILIENGAEVHRFRYDGNVLDVKLSMDRRFVCIQRSNDMIVVLDLQAKHEAALEARATTLRGGIVWIGDPTIGLVLVAKDGLDTYSLQAGSRQWTLINSTRPSNGVVKSFWTLPSKKFVLLSTGMDGCEMRAYGLLIPKQPSKFAKFSLSQTPAQIDVALVELYGEGWVIHVQPNTLDMYRIDQVNTTLMRTMRLTSVRGSVALNTVDSLLIVHSTQQKVSLLYDVRDQGSREDLSIVHPLPLGFDDESGPRDAYGPSIVFLPPHWVLDAKLGKLWRLQIDLAACVDCVADALDVGRISSFLLRRRCVLPRQLRPPPTASSSDDPSTYGKAVLLWRVAMALAREEMQLVDVELWFRASHDAMRRPERPPAPWRPPAPMLVECRGDNGLSLVLPSEVYRLVFAPMASEVQGQRAGWMAGLLLEYQRSLLMFGHPLDPNVFELCASLLLRAGRRVELFQLMQQAGISADSPALAACTADSEDFQDAQARQLTVDVLHRLGEWPTLLKVLVASAQIKRACELVVRRPELLGADEGAQLVAAACSKGVADVRLVASLLQSVRPQCVTGPAPSVLAQVMALQLPVIYGATETEDAELKKLLGFLD